MPSTCGSGANVFRMFAWLRLLMSPSALPSQPPLRFTHASCIICGHSEQDPANEETWLAMVAIRAMMGLFLCRPCTRVAVAQHAMARAGLIAQAKEDNCEPPTLEPA